MCMNKKRKRKLHQMVDLILILIHNLIPIQGLMLILVKEISNKHHMQSTKLHSLKVALEIFTEIQKDLIQSTVI